MWGPQTNKLFDQWEKNPIEIANNFCKSILQVYRINTNNACRAQLGQYPLLLKIQKRSTKYWLHLRQNDPHSFQHKALQSQEINRSPLTQLVLLRLRPQTGSPSALPQDKSENISIRLNQIITHQKQSYLTHWNTKTHTQNKMQCYLALNRQYTVAPCLTTVTDVRHRGPYFNGLKRK